MLCIVFLLLFILLALRGPAATQMLMVQLWAPYPLKRSQQSPVYKNSLKITWRENWPRNTLLAVFVMKVDVLFLYKWSPLGNWTVCVCVCVVLPSATQLIIICSINDGACRHRVSKNTSTAHTRTYTQTKTGIHKGTRKQSGKKQSQSSPCYQRSTISVPGCNRGFLWVLSCTNKAGEVDLLHLTLSFVSCHFIILFSIIPSPVAECWVELQLKCRVDYSTDKLHLWILF